ncbi:unnamed protein product [Ophioblennius macclurei]
MLTSAQFILSVTCLTWGNMALTSQLTLALSVQQDRGFVSVNVGEDVTLRCFFDAAGESAWLFWYKQAFGRHPRLISSSYVFDTEKSFHDEFKNDPRFALEKADSSYHLVISEVQISDSATYYCVSSVAYNPKFTEGVTVIVSGAGVSVRASIDQSVSGRARLGGSVTLGCDVHVERCDGEHDVYWFKNSAEPHPRILYKGRVKECEKNADAETRDCVYHLDLMGLDQSHAGNYYCALVACGYILFGNGTLLDFSDEVNSQVVIHVLIGALTLATILVVILSGFVYKMSQKDGFRSTAPAPGALTEGDNEDDLHYAALNMRTSKRLRTQRNSVKDECVYSTVKK